MKIAIAAGGTGGHIYPGMAIAEEILARNPQAQILFLGSEEGLERDLIARAGYQIQLIKSRALLRKLSYQAISAPFVSILGFFQACLALKNFSPQAVIATGGYVSLPVVLSAKLLSIPSYLLEQNVLPGISNRFLGRLVKKVFLSFPESQAYLSGIVTGNPVRKSIIAVDREISRKNLGYQPQNKVVLIIGGSQGARHINQTVVAALPLFDPSSNIKLLHVVGQRDAKKLKPGNFSFYRMVNYLYNMEEALGAADLVISRAGATAIAEFLVRGIPMVLIPFPYSAEGHQDLNARTIEKAGAAVRLKDDEFTAEKFISILVDKKLDLGTMGRNCKKLAKPDAAEKILNAIL